MKLKKFIKESKDLEYMDEFQNQLASKYKNKKINGWEFFYDKMSGTFYWTNPTSKNVIMATPFWDGNENVPIDVINDKTGDELLSTKISLKPTGDFKKDELNYLKILKSVFQKIK